jgi:spore maturation protein SpmA
LSCCQQACYKLFQQVWFVLLSTSLLQVVPTCVICLVVNKLVTSCSNMCDLSCCRQACYKLFQQVWFVLLSTSLLQVVPTSVICLVVNKLVTSCSNMCDLSCCQQACYNHKHHIHLSTLHQHRKKTWLLDYIDIEGTRFCSEIPHTRTDQTA